jgi:hypothetical protein
MKTKRWNAAVMTIVILSSGTLLLEGCELIIIQTIVKECEIILDFLSKMVYNDFSCNGKKRSYEKDRENDKTGKKLDLV